MAATAACTGDHDHRLGHQHRHGLEALAQTPADVDPTRTKTLRTNYAQRLRGGFGRINAVIREGVRSEDVLGLRTRSGTEALAEPPPSFRFESNPTKRERFRAWLRSQLRDEVLSIISTGSNTFIQSAYGRGYQRAATELRKQGVQVAAEELADIFNRPQPRRRLQELYTRNFQALQGITEDLDQAISETLTEGFASGWNPTKMARRLTGRVDAIGKHRATILARTETIHAHNEAALDRYDEAGVEEVGAQVEFLTAGDTRVCPICESLEGETYPIEEARGLIPGKTHPQCRCTWLPVVGA